MCTDPLRFGRRGQCGFTIIELVIFIVVIGVAVAGVLGVMNLTTSRSADPQLRKQALVLAEGLLEEIQSARFTFCKPDDAAAETAVNTAGCATPQAVGQPAGTRPYLSVTDYVPAFGTAQPYIRDALDIKFPDGYSATVTLSPEVALGPADALVPADATPANLNALRITVTVSYAGGNVTLVGYRTRYAPNLI
ncbi:type IV pilus modification PilV family protein [Janthinobacterium aquaticum]|uniref:type IV pilus modification PilV family protein n=1 Tax=Janthinobacterium sp. FT58W TaxID=2654254 RepID=UPI00126468FE|nr:prepilin-type N-terminal cleavage/methylation domain-containing protein [Janthinobacterium sp. FT58W]KAB8045000.1 type II secretion system protein [Janthinobacterium sp. FT58W]